MPTAQLLYEQKERQNQQLRQQQVIKYQQEYRDRLKQYRIKHNIKPINQQVRVTKSQLLRLNLQSRSTSHHRNIRVATDSQPNTNRNMTESLYQ